MAGFSSKTAGTGRGPARSARAALPGDAYFILQVGADAEQEVIEAAYRALARKYHPDVNRTEAAGERIRQINDAYETLRDPARRVALDAQRTRTAAPPPEVDVPVRPDRPIDLFRTLAAELWSRGRPRDRVDGAPAATTRPVARPVGRRVVGAIAVAVPAAIVGAGVGVVAWPLVRLDRAQVGYWRLASAARARVAASRQAYSESLGGDVLYTVAIASPVFASMATQFIADLQAATDRLTSAGDIPRDVEAYHLAQLADWREERSLRQAYRDAAVSRRPDLWAQTAERELAWMASLPHQQVEVLTAELAARLGH